jgi:hypothetical protein
MSTLDKSLVAMYWSCGMMAHECARQVSCTNVPEEWHDNPPYCLQSLLADDCNHTIIKGMNLLILKKKLCHL